MSTSLSEEDIAEVIAGWTGIPLTKINETESEKLLSLEDTLPGSGARKTDHFLPLREVSGMHPMSPN